MFSPGLPVILGPSANAKVQQLGRELFEHEWTTNDELAGGDGLGPVFNGRSCAECHFQGGVGGGGNNKHNVFTFEVHPANVRPDVESGVIHAFATEKEYRESASFLPKKYPIIKPQRRVVNHCSYESRPFDPVRRDQINSTALFGAGWIDRISAKTIVHNRMDNLLGAASKEFQLDFSSVTPGRPRVLPDGRIGRFGWKAQFATLEEFVANACAVEIGLGTPTRAQSKPMGYSDYSDQKPDLDPKQFAALVSFVDTLPRPVRSLPEDPRQRALCDRGEMLFSSTGCAICHVPDLGGVKGIYSDLLLHRIQHRDEPGGGYGPSNPDFPPPDRHPDADEWKTPPLWGVADSAPYFHDGSCATLETAIGRHKGSATNVTKAYQRLSQEDQKAIVEFLKSLKAPTDALQPQPQGSTTLANR